MLAVDKLRALFQRAGMSAAESNAAVRNTTVIGLAELGTSKPPYRVLSGAFVWLHSPEGHAYWAGVHDRLRGAAQ